MKSVRRGILAAGHWIVDINKRIDHWPEPQTLAIVDQVISTNGGAAFNLVCDLVRLAPDLPLAGMGLVGFDPSGEYVLKTCRGLGIDTAGILQSKDVSTAFTDVMTERESGRRTFFHQPGANALYALEHTPLKGRSERIFFLGYLGLLHAMDKVDANGRNDSSRAFELAASEGMLTASDLVSAPSAHLVEQVVPCLGFLDYLFANEWEASRLVGAGLEQDSLITADDALRLGRDIRKMGLKGTAVIHFPGGAVCVGPNGDEHCQGAVCVPASDIVGTTGAGDAFAAGYLLGVHEGLTAQESLELATCSAAVSLRDITVSDALMPWRECLQFGRSLGYRSI